MSHLKRTRCLEVSMLVLASTICRFSLQCWSMRLNAKRAAAIVEYELWSRSSTHVLNNSRIKGMM